MSDRHDESAALVLLAGGRSRRFGRDKALADFEGAPLVVRALRRLAAVAPRRVVVRVAELPSLPTDCADVVRVADPRPGDGPLQALAAAFAAAPASRWFVAPCDLPWLEASVYTRLARALDDSAADGTSPAELAVARAPDGLEPLVSVWTPAAVRELASFLDCAPTTTPSVHAALGRLSAVEVEFADARPFLNVNTPEEFAAARRSETPRVPSRQRQESCP